ncbi:DUF455 family protein [Notoacmeibacter ruber]|uniref:DUF455 family protein n=1 Tax=Notoacmeibacter ruber TaxID=2670375 RepID=A0A3L7JGZ2_9HYPH|nr:DUF455 family protein [Notoacmeibacter ruber]
MGDAASVRSLRDGASRAVAETDLDRKVALTRELYRHWLGRHLSLHGPLDQMPPDRPGRPERPELVPPRMLKRRSLRSVRGRIALLHALAHIELNAIDLALDIVARFAAEPMPRSFFDGWMLVAFEEAKHFSLLRERLSSLDAAYGDLPAHDGLWQAAQDTKGHLFARLAIVPLVLEARGLDVTPSMVNQLNEVGDMESAAILRIIYEDEKGHVATGAKWFRFCCAREGVEPAASFRRLVREHFHGQVKPPFNAFARSAAGLTPTFWRGLSSVSNSDHRAD